MEILRHADPVLLEEELLRQVDRRHPRNEPGSSWIVVPTNRLVEHLPRRLAGRRNGWLGLEVLHFRTLAVRLIESAGGLAPRVISERLRESLVRQALAYHQENRWSVFAEQRPGVVPRLTGALNELREAGITPDELEGAVLEDPYEAALAELYRPYAMVLEEVASAGWADEAGLVGRAAAALEQGFQPPDRVFVHGAYEWIGVQLELLRELARRTEMLILLPGTPGTPAAAYVDAFAEEQFASVGTALPDALPIARRFDLGALFDEAARPAPAAESRFGCLHAQGSSGEVRAVVRRAMKAIDDGVAPEEILIVARNLERYAAALEEVFEGEGIPWTSSLTGPLRRQPWIRDLLRLLRTVADGYPRRVTSELLRSPRIRWDDLGEEVSRWGASADEWSRGARITGGLDEWRTELPSWAEQPRTYAGQSADGTRRAHEEAGRRGRRAGAIVAALEALDRRIAPAAFRWSEHADRLDRLRQDLIVVEEDERTSEALAGWSELLEEMRGRETLLGETEPVAFLEMLTWLEQAADRSTVPVRRGDQGGIRVLGALQARGLTFERVYWIGLNSDVFPRPPREDPVLGDALRRRLGEITGLPLPRSSRGLDEERLLLGLLLGASAERTEVSWQRADERGRSRTPSLALREIARVAMGHSEFDRIVDGAEAVPSHPLLRLQSLVDRPGVLSPAEGRLHDALASGDSRDFERLGGRHPELVAGLRMLEATQAFREVDAGYDGRVAPQPTDALSVSAWRTLGTCPLMFFFQKVLGLRQLDDETGLFEISNLDVGNQVHEVLEELYGKLVRDGAFEDAELSTVLGKARDWLDRNRDTLLGRHQGRLARRLPVLHRVTSNAWRETLERFVEADLKRMIGQRWQPTDFEVPGETEVDLGDGMSVRIRGRFDRVLRGADGETVSDYKTSKKVSDLTSLTEMLRGNSLQVPLYRLLRPGRPEVEVLGVGPGYDYNDPKQWRAAHDGLDDDAQAGLMETLRVLLRLPRSGSFPLRKSDACKWCAFREACRHNHPPTLEREQTAADSRSFRRLAGKGKDAPLLRGGEGAG